MSEKKFIETCCNNHQEKTNFLYFRYRVIKIAYDDVLEFILILKNYKIKYFTRYERKKNWYWYKKFR